MKDNQGKAGNVIVGIGNAEGPAKIIADLTAQFPHIPEVFISQAVAQACVLATLASTLAATVQLMHPAATEAHFRSAHVISGTLGAALAQLTIHFNLERADAEQVIRAADAAVAELMDRLCDEVEGNQPVASGALDIAERVTA
jgi:hypothetical protein